MPLLSSFTFPALARRAPAAHRREAAPCSRRAALGDARRLKNDPHAGKRSNRSPARRSAHRGGASPHRPRRMAP